MDSDMFCFDFFGKIFVRRDSLWVCEPANNIFNRRQEAREEAQAEWISIFYFCDIAVTVAVSKIETKERNRKENHENQEKHVNTI